MIALGYPCRSAKVAATCAHTGMPRRGQRTVSAACAGMMAGMSISRWARLLILGGVAAIVIAVGLAWYATRGPCAEVVEQPTDPTGWKAIEYEGVRVGFLAPGSGWTGVTASSSSSTGDHPTHLRADRRGASPSTSPRRSIPPTALTSRRTETPGSGAAEWAGYVYAGDFAVYASDDDRAVVERVLDSAH